MKLEYLDMFIKEVLRMFPIANKAITRRATKSTRIKHIDIPEGLSVVVDVLSLHFDPELWGPVDPYEFYPCRFSPGFKRSPLSFMSFGNGPRNCVGMKFAFAELKIALVKIILNFEIRLSDKNAPIELRETEVRQLKNGVNVILKKRA